MKSMYVLVLSQSESRLSFPLSSDFEFLLLVTSSCRSSSGSVAKLLGHSCQPTAVILVGAPAFMDVGTLVRALFALIY